MSEKKKTGRPPLSEEGAAEHKIMVRVTDEQMARIEELAKFCELPKTTMAKNLLMSGVEQAEALRTFGFMHIAKGLIRSSDFIKDFSKQHKRAIEEGKIAF